MKAAMNHSLLLSNGIRSTISPSTKRAYVVTRSNQRCNQRQSRCFTSFKPSINTSSLAWRANVRSKTVMITTSTSTSTCSYSTNSSPQDDHHQKQIQSNNYNDPESTQQMNKAKDRAAVGPFNLRAGLLFLLTGAGLLYYFQREKATVAARRASENQDAKIGRPRIGGPFQLLYPAKDPKTGRIVAHKVDQNDLQGSFSLIYFGFTNCPDICPEELDKMGEVVDMIAKSHGPIINPIFVSCDPARDTLSAVSTYISDFHPSMIGLTGSFEAVKSACKAYRVYFSTPPSADPNSDYLVDHSIFFYLMDPEGRFVDAFGRALDKDEVHEKVEKFVNMWKDGGNEIAKADLKERIQNDQSRKVES